MRWILAAAVLCSAPSVMAQTPSDWRLAEEVRIELADGTEPLSRIGSVTVSPDRTELFVTQPLEHIVRVFDAQSGRFLRSIGGDSGRDEFRQIESIGWVRDTLYVTDRLTKRVSLFTARGEYLESWRIDPPLQAETGHASHPIGLTADGNVISEVGLTAKTLAEGAVSTSPWALLTRDGNFIRALALRDLRETTGVVAVPQGRVFFGQPLSQRNYLALHPAGTSMAVVSQPAGSDPPGYYDVARLRPDGTPIFKRRTDYTPRPVSPAVADRLRADYLRNLEGGSTGARLRTTVERLIRIPPFHPPISRVVLGRDDRLWLRTAADADATTEWVVLGPDGQVDATVRLPEHLDILYADESTVWATATHAIDAPTLVRLRIER